MFLENFIYIILVQIITIGTIAIGLYFISTPKKKYSYDDEFLYISAQNILLETFLQNRFPGSVSVNMVPVPDGKSIPAPITTIQNYIPLTALELSMRENCIKMFLRDKYGDIKNFHKDVVEAFSVDEEIQSTESQESEESQDVIVEKSPEPVPKKEKNQDKNPEKVSKKDKNPEKDQDDIPDDDYINELIVKNARKTSPKKSDKTK